MIQTWYIAYSVLVCFFYIDDQVRYGAVIMRSIFRPNPHNGPITARPWGRHKGYLLRVQLLIFVLLQPLYGFMWYHIKLDRVTAAPDRIWTHSSIALHPSTAGCPAVLPQRSEIYYFGYRNKWNICFINAECRAPCFIYLMSSNECHQYFVHWLDTNNVYLIYCIFCSGMFFFTSATVELYAMSYQTRPRYTGSRPYLNAQS